MLLLLTLAVLAGATCRAQNILGNKVGSYFYIHGEEQGEIKAIRIFYSLLRRLKGIQLQFQNHWSNVYGGHSTSYEEFHLKDGEHVIKVHGNVGICLNSLTFITNKGTEFTFGKKVGQSIEASGGPDQHLQTVNGMYSLLCLRGIGFKWTRGPEKPQREPTTIPDRAMLLLLTLAVLAGATCRAQNILGNTIGSYFYIHGEEQGEIKAIRIFYSLLRRLKG
ncbi:prostatic spermine-binding protein-like [Peromyscus californicus insignis]|uniref:prostatic spermine-binding protein-like n=1 Tax=Peromyscus californicus insignis TaxID=564181 RepID=UPI0022A71AD1|nr:prostatic spermine-binding protein-like [Peromyscus californicus insignis]